MRIRNFCIIAHIDHGKSTLADRLLELTGTVVGSKMQEQLLDSLALERERGITIKLAPVRMKYYSKGHSGGSSATDRIQNIDPIASLQDDGDGEEYILNLIDTPGHVDFSYEVSRALAAVEGAILLVDATQGIQAQTLSHGLAALEQNLILIPVINKIDLPNADIEKAKQQLIETFGFNEDEILLASGKSGVGVEEILKTVIEKVPAPVVDENKPLKALIFDSFFDAYKGVVAQVKIVEGRVPKNETKLKFLGTSAVGEVLEKGTFSPSLKPTESLVSGEIGYIATGIKESDLVRVGDTITEVSTADQVEQLPGYKTVKPMVYVGLYPIDQSEFHELKDVLAKFKLTDPAFSYEPENSQALGAGFRCGFLGLLHAEVVQQRLSEEFDMDLLATTPSVQYLVNDNPVTNPAEIDFSQFNLIKEPWVTLKMFTPQNFIGGIMDLIADKRGIFQNMTHYGTQVELFYEMPLSEMITDFYDKLKSVSSGFASLDWDFLEYREVDAVRVDIMVGGEKVDALSTIMVKSRAEFAGRRLCEKLKEVLPRQSFEIAIQAAIGGKIIARETVSAFRKDVLMHGSKVVGGGDFSRKRKLLEKQKKGKKKMKMIGRVEIPQEAFLSILKS